jgi:TPP-dependent pyruvate/acetoin dehydrogenase alpha subunit
MNIAQPLVNLNLFVSCAFSRTQLPHSVGAAYSLKMDKKQACAVTFFGDGGTSEVSLNSQPSHFLLAQLSFQGKMLS